MSGVPAPNTKKRKKLDAKPQSQINKCLNEKRRREQENIYIEELAELISASFADMNSLSVKPDKCAILQETVNQIRHIKQQEHCSSDAAVQQGEVSSSNPTVLRNEVFGPLLLEALDGFLFVVNLDGKIEFATDNVDQFIKYSREDILGKSIYNFIHHGDHARFSSSLLPMSMSWPEPNTQNSRKTFECRLLVKPPDDNDSTMEEKQQRVSKYENMSIQCTQMPLNRDKGELADGDDVTSESGDVGLSLMCVARRIPQNEKTVGTPIEQFAMKLDTSGKILGIDVFGVSAAYSQYLNKDLIDQIIQELVHPLDLPKLSQHLRDTLSNGTATSAPYRLRVGSPDKFVRVKTVSKFFKANLSLQEPECIMATHSIIGDLDVASPESAVSSPPSSTSVGGPLMSGSNGTQLNSSSAGQFTYDLGLSEFGELFPTSTSWDATPDSRTSLTPSRPPSIPAYSPAPATSFPYSPSPFQEEEKDIKEEPQESGRLRNLLTQRSSVDEETAGRNVILKQLLREDPEEGGGAGGGGERQVNGRISTPPVNNNNNNNHMLLKLLNDKSDDDDMESRADIKKQNELLQQLLKEQTDDRKPNANQEDHLLKSLGFRNSSPSSPSVGQSSLIGNRKRPSDEGDGNGPGGKRPNEQPNTGVSSTGKSKLWEKNQMLASLLARDSPKQTTIPPIPTSVISASPQDKLPKIGKPHPGSWPGSNMQGGAPGRPPGPVSAGKPQRMPNTQFLNQMLSHPPDPQNVQLARQLQDRVNVASGQIWPGGAVAGDQSDPVLSDLLDQVIDIVPDAECTDSSQILTLLDQMDSAQPPNQTVYRSNHQMEMQAINEIQRSLMMCETAVKSPQSPNPFPSSPGQPAGFPPPPMYQPPQRARFAARPQQFQQQQVLLQRKLLVEKQQQQKQRLLQAQQQQQMLIPSNAAADPQTLSSIDSLLNNTVAPNVSLQRSSSVSESQLSPSYSNQMLSNGVPISSPHPHSPQGWATPTQARLSPHNSSQLSPRITQGQQTGYTVTSPGQQPTAWQQNNRLMQQQQQNPMLNAQLQGGYGNGAGRFPGQARAGQPGRALTSPGPGPRQSPFTPEAFPPPASPTGYQPQYSPQQQQQQMRLQRSVSTPNATTQLPGGPSTPRHYYGKEMPRHFGYPTYPSHPSPSPDHMMYPSHEYYDAMYPRPPLQQTDYVRQELRAVVGARTHQLAPPASPRQHIQQVSAAELEALGLSFEMPSGPSESPKMWVSIGADLGATSPQAGLTSRQVGGMEGNQQAADEKSASLLKKLLSD